MESTKATYAMLLYDAFFLPFSLGSGIVFCLTGMLFDVLSMSMFGKTKISLYLFVIEIDLLIIAFTVYCAERTLLFWLVISTLFGTYLTVYSFYPMFRCFHFFKSFKNYAIAGNIVMWAVYIVFTFGSTGFIPNYIGTLSFAIAIPFPFGILTVMCYRVVTVIKSSPIYHQDKKQKTLMRIFEATIFGIYLFGVPCMLLSILSGIYLNGAMLFGAVTLAPLIKFLLTMTNFGIMMNKSLDSCVAKISEENYMRITNH